MEDPDISDDTVRLDDDDRALHIRLAAILRLTGCLERGHNADIDEVIAPGRDRQLRFTLISDEYPVVGLWPPKRNAAGLMEDTFGQEGSFDSLTPLLEWSEAEPAPSGHPPPHQ